MLDLYEFIAGPAILAAILMYGYFLVDVMSKIVFLKTAWKSSCLKSSHVIGHARDHWHLNKYLKSFSFFTFESESTDWEDMVPERIRQTGLNVDLIYSCYTPTLNQLLILNSKAWFLLFWYFIPDSSLCGVRYCL